MKLIIDINDRDYELLKNAGITIDFNTLFHGKEKDRELTFSTFNLIESLKNGTPYNSQDRWIPVSERLPEEDGVYLVTLEYVEDSEIVNEIDMARFTTTNDLNNGFHKVNTIIAWQPLPEPYKEGEEE